MNRNYVAKYMNQFNRSSVQEDRKKAYVPEVDVDEFYEQHDFCEALAEEESEDSSSL